MSALNLLLENREAPTVGEIAYSLRLDLYNLRARHSGQAYDPHGRERYLALKGRVYEFYDTTFTERPDYRLWRIVEQNRYGTPWTGCDPKLILSEAAMREEPEILWELLRLIACGVTSNARRLLIASPQIMGVLPKLLNMPRLAGAEIECALVELFAYTGLLKYEYLSYGTTPSIPDLQRRVAKIEECIRRIDPTWIIGGDLSLRQIQLSRRSFGLYFSSKSTKLPHRLVLTFADIVVQLPINLSKAFSCIRGAINHSIGGVKDLNTRGNLLVQRAFQFMYSSWRLMRSARIALQKSEASNRAKLAQVIDDEMNYLYVSFMAAQDAGKYQLSFALAQLLLRVLPEELLKRPGYATIETDMAFYVRQAGLMVDNRQSSADETEETIELPDLEQDKEVPDNRLYVSRVSKRRIAVIRIDRDRVEDSRWRIILNSGYSFPNPHGLNPLYEIRKCPLKFSDESRRAAYELLLKYGLLKKAAIFLRHDLLRATRANLMAFVPEMRKAFLMQPLDADFEQHQKWQAVVRKTWVRLKIEVNEHLPIMDLLLLHEALLGRTVSFLRSVDAYTAKMLIRRFYDSMSDVELRTSLEGSLNLGSKSSNRSISEGLRRLVSSSPAALGPPAWISVVSMNLSDSWSILATDGECWIQDEETVSDLSQTASAIQLAYRLRRERLPWGSRFQKLGEAIIRTIRRLSPTTRSFSLALEPWLAALPWQNLLNVLAPGRFLVSLIPSIHWAATHDRTLHTTNRKRGVQLLSYSVDLTSVREFLEQDENILDRSDAAIVMGHGHVSFKAASGVLSEDLPTISVGDPPQPLGLERWLGIADHRLVIVHSCFGGHTNTSLLGDLAGIPGVALGIRTHLFCAPVCEIPPEAAIVLQKALVKSERGVPFGESYLKAIAENSFVSMYNLYGAGAEPFWRH